LTRPTGRIFHTGDWKLDDTPQLGDPSTEAELRAIGDAGVLALVCDSTNVFQEASSGSELGVRQGLDDVIQDADCRVLVTTFASNAARLKTLGHVAQDTGRQVCVAGRSLDRILRVAKSVGYLTDFPEIIDFDEAMKLPRCEVMIIATGGQGEARAALARIAFDQHKLRLERGDLVIFSSKQIPATRSPSAASRTSWPTGHRDDHRQAGPGPRLRPSRPARARRHVRLDPARDHRPGPWRDAPHVRAGALRQARGIPHGIVQKNGDLVRLAPNGPKSSARSGSAG
jgi:ribonuclease J